MGPKIRRGGGVIILYVNKNIGGNIKPGGGGHFSHFDQFNHNGQVWYNNMVKHGFYAMIRTNIDYQWKIDRKLCIW